MKYSFGFLPPTALVGVLSVVACGNLDPLQKVPLPEGGATTGGSTQGTTAGNNQLSAKCRACLGVGVVPDAGGTGGATSGDPDAGDGGDAAARVEAGLPASYCYTPCGKDGRCTNAFQCLEFASCIEGRSRDEAVSCGLPCAQQAGITTQEDPSAKLLLGLLDCAVAQCPTDCLIRP